MCNKVAVLVPPCMLAPGFQVKTATDCSEWWVQYLQLFVQNKVDIIPYTCAESSFEGYENGLLRMPHGIDYYKKLDGYEEHCRNLAKQMAHKICSMRTGGYNFAAIVGIEHSPSCAVNYIYSNKGMLRRSGLFIDSLKEELNLYVINIPYIGINRKHTRKSVEALEKILKNSVMNN